MLDRPICQFQGDRMSTPEQKLLAKEIIENTRLQARARAVLNRPPFSPFLTLIAVAAVASVIVLLGRFVPAAERSTTMLAIVGVWTVINAVHGWIDRRRLEAAITLLKMRDKG